MRRLFIRALIPLFVVLLLPLPLLAAGSCTVSHDDVTSNIGVITFTWIGDASSGSVPDTSSSPYRVDGYVFLVKTSPGTPAPADNYNITLTDSDGIDVMGGELLLRDTANPEMAVPKIDSVYGEVLVHGYITHNITSQTDASATGVTRVYYRR